MCLSLMRLKYLKFEEGLARKGEIFPIVTQQCFCLLAQQYCLHRVAVATRNKEKQRLASVEKNIFLASMIKEGISLLHPPSSHPH